MLEGTRNRETPSDMHKRHIQQEKELIEGWNRELKGYGDKDEMYARFCSINIQISENAIKELERQLKELDGEL